MDTTTETYPISMLYVFTRSTLLDLATASSTTTQTGLAVHSSAPYGA